MLNQKLLMKYGDFKKVNSKGSKKNDAIKAVRPPPHACRMALVACTSSDATSDAAASVPTTDRSTHAL